MPAPLCPSFLPHITLHTPTHLDLQFQQIGPIEALTCAAIVGGAAARWPEQDGSYGDLDLQPYLVAG
jgi:hypothetical protein